jgi:hypothetical protein
MILIAIISVVILLVAIAAIWFFLIRETDEDAITSTIDKFAAGDPESCDLITDDLVEEQNSGLSVDEARQRCREEIEPAGGEPVLSNLQITGNRASITITVEGGENDGQSEDAVLIKEDGTWKIDEFSEPDE